LCVKFLCTAMKIKMGHLSGEQRGVGSLPFLLGKRCSSCLHQAKGSYRQISSLEADEGREAFRRLVTLQHKTFTGQNVSRIHLSGNALDADPALRHLVEDRPLYGAWTTQGGKQRGMDIQLLIGKKREKLRSEHSPVSKANKRIAAGLCNLGACLQKKAVMLQYCKAEPECFTLDCRRNKGPAPCTGFVGIG